MAQKLGTKFVPLDGGLDTFKNPLRPTYQNSFGQDAIGGGFTTLSQNTWIKQPNQVHGFGPIKGSFTGTYNTFAIGAYDAGYPRAGQAVVAAGQGGNGGTYIPAIQAVNDNTISVVNGNALLPWRVKTARVASALEGVATFTAAPNEIFVGNIVCAYDYTYNYVLITWQTQNTATTFYSIWSCVVNAKTGRRGVNFQVVAGMANANKHQAAWTNAGGGTWLLSRVDPIAGSVFVYYATSGFDAAVFQSGSSATLGYNNIDMCSWGGTVYFIRARTFGADYCTINATGTFGSFTAITSTSNASAVCCFSTHPYPISAYAQPTTSSIMFVVGMSGGTATRVQQLTGTPSSPTVLSASNLSSDIFAADFTGPVVGAFLGDAANAAGNTGTATQMVLVTSYATGTPAAVVTGYAPVPNSIKVWYYTLSAGVGTLVASQAKGAQGGAYIAGYPVSMYGVPGDGAKNLAQFAWMPIKNGDTAWTGSPTINQSCAPTGYIIPLSNNTNLTGTMQPVATFGAGFTPDPVANKYISHPIYPINDASSSYTFTIPYAEIIFADQISTLPAAAGKINNAQYAISLFTASNPVNNEYVAAPVQLGKSFIFAGSYNATWDGKQTKELGFWHQPPPMAAAWNAAGGNITGVANGVYYYVYTYEWTDAQGQLHRSAPSYPFPVIQTVTSTGSVSLAAPALPFTRLLNLTVVFYRTASSAVQATSAAALNLVYYKVKSIPIYFSEIASSGAGCSFVTYTDTANDLTGTNPLTAGSQLYTFANGVSYGPPTAPPPFTSMAVWQNALWGAAYNNGSQIWASWPYTVGGSIVAGNNVPEAPSFGNGNYIDLPATMGEIQAIAAFDDKLMVFGRENDYAISGAPPSRTQNGLNSTVALYGPIPGPGGMSAQNAFVRLPGGIMYQSRQGFVILDRALAYQFEGDDIKSYSDATTYGRGVLFTEGQVVMFPSNQADGTALLYNYNMKKWMYYKGASTAGVGSESAFGSGFSFVNPTDGTTDYLFRPSGAVANNNVVPIYNPENTTDAPAAPMILETPWIEFNDVAGYGSIQSMQFLAAYLNPHTVKVETAFDYSPTYTQTQTVTVASTPGDEQYRFDPIQPRCRAVRYKLTITPTASLLPCVVTGLMVYYAVDEKLTRLPNARTN